MFTWWERSRRLRRAGRPHPGAAACYPGDVIINASAGLSGLARNAHAHYRNEPRTRSGQRRLRSPAVGAHERYGRARPALAAGPGARRRRLAARDAGRGPRGHLRRQDLRRPINVHHINSVSTARSSPVPGLSGPRPSRISRRWPKLRARGSDRGREPSRGRSRWSPSVSAGGARGRRLPRLLPRPAAGRRPGSRTLEAALRLFAFVNPDHRSVWLRAVIWSSGGRRR
jgi:hypothetical protein